MTTQDSLEPWKAAPSLREGDFCEAVDVNGASTRIATFWPSSEQETYVRLFLSAPMLLEACKAALRLAGADDLPDNGEYCGAAITDLIRAAVEKAEGPST